MQGSAKETGGATHRLHLRVEGLAPLVVHHQPPKYRVHLRPVEEEGVGPGKLVGGQLRELDQLQARAAREALACQRHVALQRRKVRGAGEGSEECGGKQT